MKDVDDDDDIDRNSNNAIICQSYLAQKSQSIADWLQIKSNIG